MFNIFLAVFFSTLAFAFYGAVLVYRLSVLDCGSSACTRRSSWPGRRRRLGQCNRKIVEVDMKQKGHAFARRHRDLATRSAIRLKDTSSVAMNPIIKFATPVRIACCRACRDAPLGTTRCSHTSWRSHSSWCRCSSCIDRSTESSPRQSNPSSANDKLVAAGSPLFWRLQRSILNRKLLSRRCPKVPIIPPTTGCARSEARAA